MFSDEEALDAGGVKKVKKNSSLSLNNTTVVEVSVSSNE